MVVHQCAHLTLQIRICYNYLAISIKCATLVFLVKLIAGFVRKVRGQSRMATLQDRQRFERYQVIRYLGSGIAGESYEAEDTILQRKVALKLLHPWAMLTDAARR